MRVIKQEKVLRENTSGIGSTWLQNNITVVKCRATRCRAMVELIFIIRSEMRLFLACTIDSSVNLVNNIRTQFWRTQQN